MSWRALTLAAILLSSTACRLHERAAVAAPCDRNGKALTVEALRLLERIESEPDNKVEREIAALRTKFPGDPLAGVLASVLTEWRARRSGRHPETAETAAPAKPPPLPPETVESLKQEGIRLYSQGQLEEAIQRWNQVLEAQPDDEEARRLLARARTVLLNRRDP